LSTKPDAWGEETGVTSRVEVIVFGGGGEVLLGKGPQGAEGLGRRLQVAEGLALAGRFEAVAADEERAAGGLTPSAAAPQGFPRMPNNIFPVRFSHVLR
jgi:hypothetical protein